MRDKIQAFQGIPELLRENRGGKQKGRISKIRVKGQNSIELLSDRGEVTLRERV